MTGQSGPSGRRRGCQRFEGETCACTNVADCTDELALRFYGRMQRMAEFEAAYPRIHCPACHKRLSNKYDVVNAGDTEPAVRLHCRHCDHRFELPRRATADA